MKYVFEVLNNLVFDTESERKLCHLEDDFEFMGFIISNLNGELVYEINHREIKLIPKRLGERALRYFDPNLVISDIEKMQQKVIVCAYYENANETAWSNGFTVNLKNKNKKKLKEVYLNDLPNKKPSDLTWQQKIFQECTLDSRSILSIEKFILENRLPNNFDTWLGVYQGYTGVALPVIMQRLYDAAESLQDLLILKMHFFPNEISSLIESSILNIESGASKISRNIDLKEQFKKDNLIDVLTLLEAHILQYLDTGELSKRNYQDFYDYIHLQFDIILGEGLVSKQDNFELRSLAEILVNFKNLIMKDEKCEIYNALLENMLQVCRNALQYEEQRVCMLVEVQSLLDKRTPLLRLVQEPILVYEAEKKGPRPDEKLNIEINKIQQEIMRYESKRAKALKSKNLIQAARIMSIMDNLENTVLLKKQQLQEITYPSFEINPALLKAFEIHKEYQRIEKDFLVLNKVGYTRASIRDLEQMIPLLQEQNQILSKITIG